MTRNRHALVSQSRLFVTIVIKNQSILALSTRAYVSIVFVCSFFLHFCCCFVLFCWFVFIFVSVLSSNLLYHTSAHCVPTLSTHCVEKLPTPSEIVQKWVQKGDRTSNFELNLLFWSNFFIFFQCSLLYSKKLTNFALKKTFCHFFYQLLVWYLFQLIWIYRTKHKKPIKYQSLH